MSESTNYGIRLSIFDGHPLSIFDGTGLNLPTTTGGRVAPSNLFEGEERLTKHPQSKFRNATQQFIYELVGL